MTRMLIDKAILPSIDNGFLICERQEWSWTSYRFRLVPKIVNGGIAGKLKDDFNNLSAVLTTLCSHYRRYRRIMCVPIGLGQDPLTEPTGGPERRENVQKHVSECRRDWSSKEMQEISSIRPPKCFEFQLHFHALIATLCTLCDRFRFILLFFAIFSSS